MEQIIFLISTTIVVVFGMLLLGKTFFPMFGKETFSSHPTSGKDFDSFMRTVKGKSSKIRY
ncbi:MAG: hypothetical protein V4585_04895 [Bacteroidota bacterium]